MSTVFSSTRKRRKSSRRPNRRPSRLQALEQRKLLAADGFEFTTSHSPIPAQIADLAANESDATDNSAAIQLHRIVNGTQTTDFEAVGIVNGGCSGTLIAPNAVLTAAHCVSGGTQTFEVGGTVYTGTQAIVHPEYASNDIDLAVIVLSENVQGVKPMELNRSEPSVGQTLTLVGFGGQGTATGGHDGSFGTKNVGQTRLDLVTPTSIEWDYDNANESNTAPGDSGGPALVQVNGKMLIAGVTSGGTQETAGLGDHSFDTRVDTFAEWIDGVVDGNITSGGNGGGIGDELDGVDIDLNDDFDLVGDGLTAQQLARDELDWLDANQDGAVSREEMIAGYTAIGDTDSEATSLAGDLIAQYDSNGDGVLDLQELIASYGPADDTNEFGDSVDDWIDLPIDSEGDGDHMSGSPAALAQEELDLHDTNSDGVMSRDELLAELVSQGATQHEAAEDTSWLLNEFDTNQDNLLDFDELVTSWSGDETSDTDATDVHESTDENSVMEDLDNAFDVDELADDEVGNQAGDLDGMLDPHQGCDVNGDGDLSPLDALLLINQLANQLITQLDGGDFDLFDVNNDGSISPLDALNVINRLASSQVSLSGDSSALISPAVNDGWETGNQRHVDAAFHSIGNLT